MNTEEFKKIISQAIEREVEAYAFYHAVEEKVNDQGLKTLFKELAEEERKHRVMLQNYLANDAKPLKFTDTKDYKVSKTIDKPAPTVDMKPLDGISIAIKKEEEAMEMYHELAELSTDADQKNTFTELEKMERGHKTRLEDIYTNMAFPEAW